MTLTSLSAPIPLKQGLKPQVKDMPQNARDVRNIGHYGTGDSEIAIKNEEEFEKSTDCSQTF